MTRDQFITEKILQECWHEYRTGGEVMIPGPCGCKKCNAPEGRRNPNFSTWPDKGRLLDFCMGQEWWLDFHYWCWRKHTEWHEYLFKYIIDNFADLVSEYRGWKG